MKKWAYISAIALLAGCVDVEDYFLSTGQVSVPGQYTFEYYGTNELLVDEEMFFGENEYSLLTLETVDDQGNPATTYALYFGDPATMDQDTVIVYCHGNGVTLESAFRRATAMANVGGKGRFGVLAVEYVGFGLADGDISEENMYLGTQAAIDWAEGQGLTEDRMYFYGVSLGSAASVGLTAAPRTLRPEKLMLEVPLASIATLSQDVLGVVLDISFLSQDNALDNIGKMPTIDQPLLLMHGAEDGYIDYESNGRALYEAYQGESGTLVVVEGAGHGNTPETMGWELYEQTVLDFILEQ